MTAEMEGWPPAAVEFVRRFRELNRERDAAIAERDAALADRDRWARRVQLMTNEMLGQPPGKPSHDADALVDERRVAGLLRDVVGRFYWICFHADVGGVAQPFMAFNGLMSKYVDLLEETEAKGLAIHLLTEPGALRRAGIKPALHHVAYLARKLHDLFEPFLDADDADELFRRILKGEP